MKRAGKIRNLLMAGAMLSPLVLSSAAFAQDEQSSGEGRERIVVIGERLEFLLGVRPDTELNENDIAAYGFDTIGDLLDEIAGEIDGSVVLINGELANGVNDISDLPTEAASKIEILPATVSARLGQSPSRRVINVVLKPDLAQVTTSAEAGLATRGDAFNGKFDVNLLKLVDNNRRSLVARVERTDGLLESERNIRPDFAGIPFDQAGNVFALSGLGGEIDPMLSAIVGRLVTVAGVPAAITPTLADFAANANSPNLSGARRIRSLVDTQDVYSLNGNITERFGPRTSLAINGRIEHTESGGLSGLSGAVLTVPGASPFSPFGRDVALASLLGSGLQRNQEATSANLGATLNTQVGRFNLSASANYSHREADTVTDRDYDLAALQAGILAGTINPFAPADPAILGPVRRDRSRSNSDFAEAQLVAAGPLVTLPTGVARLTVRAGGRLERLESSTVGAFVNRADRFSRDEANLQTNLMIPLLPFGGLDIGQVTADLTFGLKDVSVSGTLETYGGALNWLLAGGSVNLRGAITDEELPTSPYLLRDPIVTTENFRVFDFLRNETVFVTYVTGGNPDLPSQRRRRTQISANATPFDNINLTLTGEYTRLVTRNSIAFLPPANAEVQAAFPDRYIRDASGTLIRLDARPVSYERDLVEFLRWGFDFRRTFGGSGGGGSAFEGDEGPSLGTGWRTAVRFDHTWYLNNTRLARTGLPEIDLLAGGALGYGGGQPRHQFQGSVATYHRGVGFQIFGGWTGRSLINSGTLLSPSTTVFDERLKIDLRTFANLGPLFPATPALKGTRITLEVQNLLDSKQRVFDANGATPLRYQPFLIDPVGRAVKLSLRKVF